MNLSVGIVGLPNVGVVRTPTFQVGARSYSWGSGGRNSSPPLSDFCSYSLGLSQ